MGIAAWARNRKLIGRLGRGDHPVKRIVARAASDGLESHEEHQSTEIGKVEESYSNFFYCTRFTNLNLRVVKARFKGWCFGRSYIHPLELQHDDEALNIQSRYTPQL